MNPDVAQKLLKVISRNGMIEILLSLKSGPKRFSQLMFDTQLNPGILDRHLKALLEVSLVEKSSENYMLTNAGKVVLEKISEMLAAYESAIA